MIFQELAVLSSMKPRLSVANLTSPSLSALCNILENSLNWIHTTQGRQPIRHRRPHVGFRGHPPPSANRSSGHRRLAGRSRCWAPRWPAGVVVPRGVGSSRTGGEADSISRHAPGARKRGAVPGRRGVDQSNVGHLCWGPAHWQGGLIIV